MHKDPKSISSEPYWAINQFSVITYFTVVAMLIVFFNLKIYCENKCIPIYHEMLSKDSHGLFILLQILQPKSIPHLVQHAESMT